MRAALDDLPTLALFAQVVRLRSFTAAAREAGLAKSAVSKRISRLEDRLGVRLLHRTTRRLALTADGLRFYQHCAALVAAAAAAHDAVAGAADVVAGVLRVNAPVTFGQLYLARALTAFLLAHPGVEVHLTADDRLVDVVEGGYDLAIRIGRLRDTSLVARRLAVDRLVVCAAPSYLARAGTPVHPEELVHHNCLRYGLIAADDEWRFRGPDGPYAVPTRGSLVASNGTILREAALAGLGLAVVPRHMIAGDLADGRLVLVLDGHRRAEIGIHALYPDRRLPARSRALLDFVTAWFADADWLALATRAPLPPPPPARPPR
jgi:DNA-binding transcriptional LysR family regulator